MTRVTVSRVPSCTRVTMSSVPSCTIVTVSGVRSCTIVTVSRVRSCTRVRARVGPITTSGTIVVSYVAGQAPASGHHQQHAEKKCTSPSSCHVWENCSTNFWATVFFFNLGWLKHSGQPQMVCLSHPSQVSLPLSEIHPHLYLAWLWPPLCQGYSFLQQVKLSPSWCLSVSSPSEPRPASLATSLNGRFYTLILSLLAVNALILEVFT